MTSVFEQRLAEILQVPVYARATVDEAKRTGRLAKAMGMDNPAPDKDTDDLALTRFPAGIPADMEEGVREALSKYHEMDYDGELAGKCLRVGSNDYNKPLLPPPPKKPKPGEPPVEQKPFVGFDELEVHDKWSTQDIIVGAWPLIERAAKEYSAGMWNKTKGSIDQDAFEEFAQTSTIEILRSIKNEEDRGDPYLSYLKLKLKHAASSGVGGTNEDDAATGLIGKMVEAGSPASLDKAIFNSQYGLSQEVIDNPDLKPRQGNRFGTHAREIIPYIEPLRDILTRSADKATRADAAHELDQIRHELKGLADKINLGKIRIFGAKSGQYDSVTTTHSDSPIVRWLKKIIKATNEDELAAVGPPPNKNDEATGLAEKYIKALMSNDEHEMVKMRDAATDWLVKAGGRDEWRNRHRREGTHQKAPSGEEEPHPGVVSKDTIENLDEVLHTKDAARAFLMAGIALDPKTKMPKGVEWTDAQGRPQYDSFIDVNELKNGNIQRAYRDYRLLIRHFGIADYPLKDTGRDPEVNQKLFDELTEKFIATIDGGLAASVTVKPISKAEAIWVAEVTAKTIAADSDSRDYFQAKEDLLDFYSDTKEIAIVCPDEDVAINLARRFASSKWVRRGCPAMKSGEVDQDRELWDDPKVSVDGKAGAKLGELIARPKPVKGDNTEFNYIDHFIGKGGIDPKSRIARMAKTLKPKLGINFDEYPWAEPKADHKKAENKVGTPETTPHGGTEGVDPPKDEKTESRKARAAILETYWKAHRMCQYFLKHAYLTESLDAFDRGLLHKVQNSLARGIVNTIAPNLGR